MNLVDASGWLEYLADGRNAYFFNESLNDLERLIVPTICLYEVFKVILRERGENAALQATALMRQAKTVDLTPEISILAAKNSLELGIPMADSIIFTTAEQHDAVVWTQDSDFQKLENVKYVPKE